MNKVVYVFIIAVLFTACKLTNKDIKGNIKVGGIEIKIPSPGNEFRDMLNNPNIHIQAFGANTVNILCMFTDTSEYKYNKKGVKNTTLKHRNINIETIKITENTEFNENEFLRIKKGQINLYKRDFNQINKIADSLLNDNLKINSDKDFNNLINLGCINDTLNTFGIMQFKEIKVKKEYRKTLIVINGLRVKNRSLHIRISTDFYNNDDLKWIIETSKAYCKAILDANK